MSRSMVWAVTAGFVLAASVSIAAPAAASAGPSSSTASSTVAPRTITHEDLWLMRRIGAPQPSPDGKWVVASITEPAYDAKAQVSDLWLIPTDRKDGRTTRRLTGTSGGGAESPGVRTARGSCSRRGVRATKRNSCTSSTCAAARRAV